MLHKTSDVGLKITQVTSYMYLGYQLRIGTDNQAYEIKRSISLTWSAYGRFKCILKEIHSPLSHTQSV